MTLNARERFRQRAAEGGQGALFVPEATWTAPTEMPSLRGVRELSIDFETKEVDLKGLGIGIRHGSKAVGMALGLDDGRRFYFPVAHDGGGNMNHDLVLRWAKEELNEFEGEVTGAHLAYDLDYAAEWGVAFPNAKAFHDVQVIETLLDENKVGEYNLDALALAYLGEGKDEADLMEMASAYGFSTPRSAKSNLWRFPAHGVGRYAEGDADRPLRIRKLQMPLLSAEGLDPIYEVERELLPELVLMRRRGIRVDVPAVERQRAKWVKELAVWQAKLKDFAGPRAELSEPLSFYRALEDRGVPVPRTPNTDQPSVTKPTLERHASDPMVRTILNGRKIATLINTFVDGQILGHLVNGRVHPTWNQLKGDDDGTIARLSGANPNMQFIPKRDADWLDGAEVAPLVRAFFLPDGDDEWQRDDYSQIEYRFLAHFGRGRGAEEVRERYRNDPKTDFHKMTARMLHVDPEDKRKRLKVKITNFGKVYGAQAPKLATMFGCSLEEASEFVEEYDRELPFVQSTLKAADGWAQKRGFVVTVMDRRRRYPFWGPRRWKREGNLPLFRDRAKAEEHYGGAWKVERAMCFTALNGKLQGSSADLIKKSIVDLKKVGVLKVLGPLLSTIHDENNASVPRTKIGDEAGREMTRIMEDCLKISVPIVVESGRGKNWKEAD